MLETSARLLRLLAVLQTRRDWSGAELAESLEVSGRTLRRDVDKLRALGYPVDAVGGVGGGYCLRPGASLPPLLLSDEEAVAMVVGLRTAAAGTLTDIAETSVRALAKLDQVLPSRLRRQSNAIDQALVTAPMLGPTVDNATLVTIATAIRDRQRLRFEYAAPDGCTTAREVEPHHLVHSGLYWYLFCWDNEKSDWRRFRVDRLSTPRSGGRGFVPREIPGKDAAEHFVLGMTSHRFRYQAVLTMHGSAREVADEVPTTIGLVEPIDEHTCTLRIGSDSLDQLAVWVAAFGFEFEIREPVELVEHLRELTARLQRAARASAPRRGPSSGEPARPRPS